MMIMMFTKDFKTVDGHVISCKVTDVNITMSCRGFNANYLHSQVNEMITLHNEILSDKTMKDVQKFINESREPEQLSLF